MSHVGVSGESRSGNVRNRSRLLRMEILVSADEDVCESGGHYRESGLEESTGSLTVVGLLPTVVSSCNFRASRRC